MWGGEGGSRMEMQGMRENKGYFFDGGDGALANFNEELRRVKRSVKRALLVLGSLCLLGGIVLFALIIVAASQARTIRHLKAREGLIPHPNVTFASNSGDQSVNGLTYGGSLFRGSGFWATRNPLPEALTDHAAIGLEDQVFIIGGANSSGVVVDEVWLYDSIYHNYTALAPMPAPRYRFGAAFLDNKIYVVGGRNSSVDSDDPLTTATFIYDVKANEWSTGSDSLAFQGDTCAASVLGKVYMVGGYGPSYSYLNTLQIYDPDKDTWSYGPTMPTARGDLMCAAFDGEIFALGGVFDAAKDASTSFSSKVESFNPNNTVWTTRPDLLTPRGDGAAVVLPGDKLLVVGGEGHYRDDQNLKYPQHVNEVYYGADETWVQKSMIPTARFRTAAATAGGLAFVFGGADVCIGGYGFICPSLDTSEVYLDVDHPHVYIYLKDEAYNDNAALTTYPV